MPSGYDTIGGHRFFRERSCANNKLAQAPCRSLRTNEAHEILGGFQGFSYGQGDRHSYGNCAGTRAAAPEVPYDQPLNQSVAPDRKDQS